MHATAANADLKQHDTDTEFGTTYTQEEWDALSQAYESTLKPINECDLVVGNVVGISNRDVLINIGFKSDGLVSLNEFRDLPDLQPGDEVEVYVEEKENEKGELILSRKKAKLVKGWEKIQEAAASEEAIESLVKRRTKGGLIMDLYGIEAFLPGSQIDSKPVRDFDALVGKKIDVAVVKINHANDNVVVSHKVLIEKSLESQKIEIINNLEKGQILEGTVKNITKFGVFIDLGGIDGLLHIKEISWGRVAHPEELFQHDEKVKVVVTDFDEAKKRISLSMRQLTQHPWEELPETIQVGAQIKGKVVKIEDYGAFIELIPGIEGLLHISEISWSQYLRNIRDIMQEGDEVEVIIHSIAKENKKMSLSMRQLTSDPWTQEDLLEKYAPGTKHEGIVRNITNLGAFVEIEEGIDGLLRTSDLSWTQKIDYPTEVLKVDAPVEVVVLKLDPENRKLFLGKKQLEENPWDLYEETFTLDSIHSGTITQKKARGAIAELAHGVEGFVPQKHLLKEDGQELQLGEKVDFRVLEFSKAHKKVILSHTDIFSTETKEVKDKSQKASQADTPKNLISEKKATLGDIAALADLKEQLTKEEDAQASSANKS